MKILLLTLVLIVVWSVPCWALDLDQINLTLHEQLGIQPQYPVIEDEREWDWKDTSLLMLRLADWGQTRYIATKTTQEWNVSYWYTEYEYQEANPLLGKHPSTEQVNKYFALCIGCDYLISKYSNPTIEKYWQYIGLTLETYCVTHNWQTGVGFKF